jgi:hypothetical protein
VSRRGGAPEDFDAEGRALFDRLCEDRRAVTAGKNLAEVDVLTLGDLVRCRMRLGAVARQLAEDGPTVTGSQGQVRPHPLLAVEQRLRAEWTAGLDRLDLTVSPITYPTESGRLKDRR